MDMLSVFITPCTNPTVIQWATITAVRRQISSYHRTYTSTEGAPSSG